MSARLGVQAKQLALRYANTDRSDHPTVVEYAVQEMFKRKSPKAAAELTARKHSGSENMFFGPGITTIDPKRLEANLWERLAEFSIKGIASMRAGKEDWALDSTIQHFNQKPSIREKLREAVVKKLGRDPFPPGT